MSFKLIVIDNFFENPYSVREFALQQTFFQLGQNIPGIRAKDINSNTYYNYKLQKILNRFYKNITIKHMFFHIMRSQDKQCLSVIIYLKPDANIDSGTCFYNNINDLFYKIMTVGNIFNRLIIFDSSVYHMPVNCFGDDIYNSRLTMNFLIECENI